MTTPPSSEPTPSTELTPITGPPATPQIVLATLSDIWDQERYDAEIRSARTQIAHGAAAVADGKVRLALVLVRLREHQDYRQWGYQSIEEYLYTVHQIGKKAANQYMRSLEALGPDLMRQLLTDAGMRRTYCLAQIRELAPEVFDELMALPGNDGRPLVVSVDVVELQQANTELRALLDESFERYIEKDAQLNSARQIVQLSGERIAMLDRYSSSVLLAHDRVAYEKAQLAKKLEGVRKEKAAADREARQSLAALERQVRELSDALRQSQEPAGEHTIIEVLATSDPKVLRGLLQVAALALRNARATALHIPTGPAQDVGAAVGDVIESGVPTIVNAALHACIVAITDLIAADALTSEERESLHSAVRELSETALPALQHKKRST